MIFLSFFTFKLNNQATIKGKIFIGVYASNEERVRGGGCLDIKKHVAELLGLENGEITGN